MSAQTRLVLSSIGLGLLLISPFFGRLLWDRWYTPSDNDPNQISRLIARRQYKDAYNLLRGLETPTPRQSLQAALCERLLHRPADAYARLHRLHDLEDNLQELRRFWMSRALDEMGEKQAALDAYSDFLATSSAEALADSVYLRLPQLHAQAGEPRRALALYTTYLERRPPLKGEILYRMAALYDRVEDPEAARRTRQRLLDEHPKHWRTPKAMKHLPPPADAARAWQYARIYFDARHYSSAVQALERFVRSYPRDRRAAEGRYLLARAYQGSGQYAKAQTAFERSHKKDKRPSAHYRIGRLLVKRNRDTKAIAHYRAFARLYPKHELAPQALWQAAKAAERNNRLTLADTLFGYLATAYPASPQAEDAAWSAGFMRYCRADYQAALESFQALSLRARQPHLVDQSLFWAGKAADRLEQPDEARLFYQQAADHFPRSYYASRAVSQGYKPTQALPPRPRAAIAAADGPPLKGRRLLERANVLTDLGLVDMARDQLLRLEKLHRGDSDALLRLQTHYERLGIWDRALLLAVRQGDAQVHRLYPEYFWDQVDAAAERARIDPHLVLSVIRQESLFRPDAVSHAGAIGLMQIMPATGDAMARRLGWRRFDRTRLFDPAVSIRMGSEFLGDQVRAFEADTTQQLSLELGLAAYNAGPHNARKWLERFPHEDSDAFVERIPYKETRLYVKKVLRNYQIYKAL